MKILLLAIFGSVLNRWRGMAHKWKKYFPRPAPQILLSMPFAYISYMHDSVFWWKSILVWIATTLTFLTGHGGFMDLGSWAKPRDDETIEIAIKWLRYKMDEYWYDVLGLTLLGFLHTLPLAIAILNPWCVLLTPATPIAYMIGHWVYKRSSLDNRQHNGKDYLGIKFLPQHLDTATDIGEAVKGLLLLGGLGVFL